MEYPNMEVTKTEILNEEDEILNIGRKELTLVKEKEIYMYTMMKKYTTQYMKTQEELKELRKDLEKAVGAAKSTDDSMDKFTKSVETDILLEKIKVEAQMNKVWGCIC
jgi:hypothetical protein